MEQTLNLYVRAGNAAELVRLFRFAGESAEEAADAWPADERAVLVVEPDAGGTWPEGLPRRYPVISVGDRVIPPAPNVVAGLGGDFTYDDLCQALVHARQWLAQQQFDWNDAAREQLQFPTLVGTSSSWNRVREDIGKVAPREATVLISGESGTGKELVARAIHNASPRSDGPFVPVNCGAIPAELLESELFGHEKGAFTGAVSTKIGRFELASGGTLFLDEIGDMPFAMQVKLLRALQEKSFERVGGLDSIRMNVRVIAATHRDLETMIENGEFREDLYYRLNAYPILIEPLRARSEDVRVLLNHMIQKVKAEQNLQVRLTEDAIVQLCAYGWPGNVRELANLVERLAIQYPGDLVCARDLPKKLGKTSPAPAQAVDAEFDPDDMPMLPINGIDLKEYLARLERSLIEQALEDTNAVVARAANRLHIRRTTLVEKMRKYGIGRD